ncbi:MAG: hypothetical protein ACYCW6_30085, partial [Candidatus Xenobia bacterium]
MKKFLLGALASLMLISPLQAAPAKDDKLHVLLDQAGNAVVRGIVPTSIGTGFLQADLAQGLLTLQQHMSVPPGLSLAAWIDATAEKTDFRANLTVPRK